MPALASPAAAPSRTRRTHRYTLGITQQCNLACDYCYAGHGQGVMSLDTARQAVDFIFGHAPAGGDLEIGFFGGEPLLRFELLRRVTDLVQGHRAYDPQRVGLTLTSNGTIFSPAIAEFLAARAFKVCISCDGPPAVHDRLRRTAGGGDSSALVERTLRAALPALPELLVNAVYHPQTFRHLPETLAYLSGLGLRRIHLNPDYTAAWGPREVQDLPDVYAAVARRYMDWYLEGDPHFVSLLDGKITVLLRGGYSPEERCQMGSAELAISHDGGIYPCERLFGDGSGPEHRLGSLAEGLDLSRLACRRAPGAEVNPECLTCGLRELCMNWCGCSNAFMTGHYNRVGPFLCASERAAIQVALETFTTLEERLGPVFLHHLSGTPHLNSYQARPGKEGP